MPTPRPPAVAVTVKQSQKNVSPPAKCTIPGPLNVALPSLFSVPSTGITERARTPLMRHSKWPFAEPSDRIVTPMPNVVVGVPISSKRGSSNIACPPPVTLATASAPSAPAVKAARLRAANPATTDRQKPFLMASPPLELASVCDKMERSSPWRADRAPGDAGPVRCLLGGKASPAMLFSTAVRSWFLQLECPSRGIFHRSLAAWRFLYSKRDSDAAHSQGLPGSAGNVLRLFRIGS